MKYYVCSDEDDALSYCLFGGHFSEEKALKILLTKKIIDKSDNLQVMSIEYGYGKKATKKEIEEETYENEFMWQQGNTCIPENYNLRVTFVELCESD